MDITPEVFRAMPPFARHCVIAASCAEPKSHLDHMRDTALAMQRAGSTRREIAEHFGTTIRTVSRWIAHAQERQP